MGAPYMFKEDNSLNNYSNKFMENNKINNTLNNLSQQKNNDFIQDTFTFSNMNYNTDSLQINKIDTNNNDLLGYDNLFSNFDNYGNDRDISLVSIRYKTIQKNYFNTESLVDSNCFPL